MRNGSHRHSFLPTFIRLSASTAFQMALLRSLRDTDQVGADSVQADRARHSRNKGWCARQVGTEPKYAFARMVGCRVKRYTSFEGPSKIFSLSFPLSSPLFFEGLTCDRPLPPLRVRRTKQGSFQRQRFCQPRNPVPPVRPRRRGQVWRLTCAGSARVARGFQPPNSRSSKKEDRRSP
jgi:hypothetical protein